MENKLEIKRFDQECYIDELKNEFSSRGMNQASDYFEECYSENLSGERVTLIAFYMGKLAGCCHLKMKSDYPLFSESDIPEINDLNVFPEFRRNGIAGKLIDEFEKIASETSETIGIGVGLYKDYGSAQRLYCKKGYIPDGNGIQYNYEQVMPGANVIVDDDLNLYFTKKIR